MITHSLAHGLASLGRNKDTMLMHVTPNEVAGLQSAARAMGGSLTTNPHTGLPEAGFFDFIGSLLPTIVGIALAPETGGGSLLPALAGGAATGAGIAAIKGDNPLMGALMGGAGGYGGAGIGSAFGAATNPGITNTVSGNVGESLASQADKLASNTALNTVGGGSTGIDFSQLAQGGGGAPGVTLSPSDLAKGALDETRGTLDAFTPQTAGGTSSMMDTGSRFVQNLGGPGSAALKLGLPAMLAANEAGMFAPEPIPTNPMEKYDPNRRLNLSGDTGLRLLASGGAVSGTGSYFGTQSYQPDSASNTNLSYSQPDGTAAQNTPAEPYGLSRLDSLTNQGANTKAANEYYAAGGPIRFASGGSSEKSLNLNTGSNTGESSNNILASANPILGVLSALGGGGTQAGLNAFGKGSGGGKDDGSTTINIDTTPKALPTAIPGVTGYKFPTGPDLASDYGYTLPKDSPLLQAAMPSYSLPGLAKGGYLDGQGDGMSDSIPGTIEGKQPARLADGEFVVPADVVSHIGNGSSKAGANRLYSMMHKVRKARTGNPSQGKQINPNKYLPA